MTEQHLNRITVPLARRLHANHMSFLGIRKTMERAHEYNRARFGHLDGGRGSLYRRQLSALLDENRPPTRPCVELHDGWALDTTMSLPHLDRVLEASGEIIAERSGRRRSATGAYRSYFQDVWTPEDAERYPAFLDFATSSDILWTVSRYLQTIPVLSTTLPSGIRFVESNTEFDDQPDRPHDSQLYHVDYYSLPNVYVLVLLRDATLESGPWTFLPKSSSQKAAAALKNWERGRGYRFSDEEVYSEADRNEVIEFAYPRGTVLFIESSGCFHYGSRNAVQPRFQLMLGYSGVCRTDFSELIMTPKKYPIHAADSRFRRMVLDKHVMA